MDGRVALSRSQDSRDLHHLRASPTSSPGQILMRPLRAISKRSMRALSWMLPLILMLVVTAHAVGPNFPPLTGRVVDDAGILSPSTIENLTGLLAQHEQATGEQVVVVTIKSLQGYAIEDFGYQLGRHWGIGQKDKNTGAILIRAPDDH